MRRGTLVCAAFLAWPLCVAAQEEQDLPSKAEAALRNGVPQTAIAPLKDAIRAGSGNRAVLSKLLARLQLAAGSPEDALATLDAAGGQNTADWKILRAAALSAQGGSTAAASILQTVAATNTEAALMLARIRAEQGDREGALSVLAETPEDKAKDPQHIRLLMDLFLSSEDPERAEKLLREIETGSLLSKPEIETAKGRVYVVRKQTSEATAAFEEALASPEIAPHTRDNARLGLARAARAAGDNGKARAVLREALTTGTTPAALRQTMEDWIILEKLAGADPTGDLRSWAAEKDTNRGIEAALQLAQLDLTAKATEAAATSLNELLGRKNLEAAQRRRAELLIAETKIAAAKSDEALALLGAMDEERDYRVAMLRGRALAASGNYRQAHETFADAAGQTSSPEEKTAAGADAFITALATGDLRLARNAFATLRELAPDDARLLEWTFLLAAADAREGKIDDLAALARRAPSTDYAFQAKLALAEWRLARGEGEAAERILKTAEPEADTPPRAASLAAAALFAADNSGSKARGELVAECQAFLAQHGDAAEATDVSFKLAELHSRGGDHAAAETVLARLADKPSDGESGALARFLAAQAASRSMSEAAADRALVWFNELAQGQSAFRYRARFEQASLLLRRRKHSDALALYDNILAGDPPAEVRHAARMERADILFALGAADPKKLDEAAAAYELVSSDQTAPPDWRDQAACKRAAALARRGQAEKALALYREILDRPPSRGADQFWFLKAGLEAARLLEEQKDWAAAVAVYDQLASASGAQREDLEQRARRLRLEHFIWEN
jgi:predicted negative regulator of RcsB-dependent stress response